MSDFVDEFSPFAQASFQELLEQLSTPGEDVAEAWPADHLQAMAATGVATWDIPTAWNGRELPPGEMLEGLRQLASASLVSTFIWTQRSAAVRRIALGPDRAADRHREGDALPAQRERGLCDRHHHPGRWRHPRGLHPAALRASRRG